MQNSLFVRTPWDEGLVSCSRENDGTEERSEGKRRGELGSRLSRAFDPAFQTLSA